LPNTTCSKATAAKKGGDNIGFNGHKRIKGDKVVPLWDRDCNVVSPFVAALDNRNESRDMGRLLKLACHWVNQEALTRTRIERIGRVHDDIAQRGLDHTGAPKRGRKKRHIGHNLLIRLRDFKNDALRFLSDLRCPSTIAKYEKIPGVLACLEIELVPRVPPNLDLRHQRERSLCNQPTVTAPLNSALGAGIEKLASPEPTADLDRAGSLPREALRRISQQRNVGGMADTQASRRGHGVLALSDGLEPWT
jgi:hypothetical protein